jgi:hypothetical protein
MFCRHIVLCLINCITETIQEPEGRMLGSPCVHCICNKLNFTLLTADVIFICWYVLVAKMLRHVVGIINLPCYCERRTNFVTRKPGTEGLVCISHFSGCIYKNYTT